MRVRVWAALISLALLAGPRVAALAPAQPKEVVFLGFGGTHEKNLREHASAASASDASSAPTRVSRGTRA